MNGIATVWVRERSFRTQLFIGGLAGTALVALQPGAVWIAVITLVVAQVLALEMMNSALEYLIDHIHPELAAEIGRAKDAAAGAVLIASIAASIIAAALIWASLADSSPNMNAR